MADANFTARINNNSDAFSKVYIPIVFLDEPNLLLGEIQSKNMRLKAVNTLDEALEVAKSTCSSMTNAIGYTAREIKNV